MDKNDINKLIKGLNDSDVSIIIKYKNQEFDLNYVFDIMESQLSTKEAHILADKYGLYNELMGVQDSLIDFLVAYNKLIENNRDRLDF